MRSQRVARLTARLQRGGRAAAWGVPSLAVVMAVAVLLRSGLGREPDELATLASALGLGCALLGSCSAWFGRSH